MGRNKRSPEEQERRAKIRELLELNSVSQDIEEKILSMSVARDRS